METYSNAEDDLRAIAAARSNLADRMYTPWWYHPILGLLMAGVILIVGDIFGHISVFWMCVPLIGTFALAFLYRKLSGINPFGHSYIDGGKRGRCVLYFFMGIGIVCSVAAFSLREEGMPGVIWGLAALMLVSTIILGRFYDHLLREQIRNTLA